MCLKTNTHIHPHPYAVECAEYVTLYVCMGIHVVKYRRCMYTTSLRTTEWAHRFADVCCCALPQARIWEGVFD